MFQGRPIIKLEMGSHLSKHLKVLQKNLMNKRANHDAIRDLVEFLTYLDAHIPCCVVLCACPWTWGFFIHFELYISPTQFRAGI